MCKKFHRNPRNSQENPHFFPIPSSRFIHCSAEEVDEFRRTSYMSNRVLVEAAHKNQLPASILQPNCLMFRKGQCRRHRLDCRFRHATPDQEEVELRALMVAKIVERPPGAAHLDRPPFCE